MSKLSPLQSRLLIMLGWFDRFCQNNDLRYYAIGGTMLGAARHQGFIPWDDDIDVAMPRKDYERLRELFNGQTDNYILETPHSAAPDFLYGYSKLYDVTTTMVESKRIDIKRGIFLDIFPLDGLGQSFEESEKYYGPIYRLNAFITCRTVRVRKDRKFYKNVAAVVSRIIPRALCDDKKLILKLDRMCAEKDYDECLYVANCYSKYRSKEIIERRLLGTPARYRFEDIEINGAELYDEYLTKIFGDWRQLPPESARKTAHDFIYLDLDSSYMQ